MLDGRSSLVFKTVFYASVLFNIDDKLLHNVVEVVGCEPPDAGEI